MKDNAALARGWIRKGDSDLADARRTVGSEGPYDTACFHAQQAVEKYLKGFLAFHGQPLPRTHDLEELQRLCTPLLSLAWISTAANSPDKGSSRGLARYAVSSSFAPFHQGTVTCF